MLKAIIASCFTLLSLSGFSQSEQIQTDRPGESLTPFTTLRKWFQLESGLGLQSEKFDDGLSDEKIFTHPELVIKYGLVKNVELRAITSFVTERQTYSNDIFTDRGIPNFQLGAKYNFIQGKGIRPFVALAAHYDFSRLRTLHKDTIDGANFRFIMLNNISDQFSLVYNIGMQWRRFGFPHAYVYTLSPQMKISEKWNAFIEVYGFLQNDRGPEHFADAGLSFLISDHVALDASAGLRISKGESLKFFGVGASYRFNSGEE